MVRDFYDDLQRAKGAEEIVYNTFRNLTDDYAFVNVSDDREYYHKGDILALGENDKKVFIEVKDDSRIGDTGNVLCEERVFYADGYHTKGNMYSEYQIYCVVSRKEQKIYVIDFKVLRQIYKQGRFMEIHHYDQYNEVFLVPLWLIKQHNGLIATIGY